MTPHSVFAVVLSWNRKADTLECLRSLSRVPDAGFRVILVDNGSGDGTADAVRREFPGVELIETGENLGYTGGNNAGIRRALDLGADYVLILNNDTVVDPGFLKELLAVASRSERIGFVSPKVYFMDPPDRVWFAGARYRTWCGYGKMTGYRQKDHGRFDRVRETDRPCGCAMLVSRAVCLEAGLLDPALFLYVDEVEWALRARRHGFASYFAPASKVWHKVSSSLGGEGHPDALYYGVRNTLYALNAQVPCGFPLLRGARNALVQAVHFLSLVTSPVPWAEGARAIRAGARDYRSGRMGRRRAGGTAGGKAGG
jgi:GT2 family glycosyltransferase